MKLLPTPQAFTRGAGITPLTGFAAYCTGQILQSLRTGQRIPPVRREPEKRAW